MKKDYKSQANILAIFYSFFTGSRIAFISWVMMRSKSLSLIQPRLKYSFLIGALTLLFGLRGTNSFAVSIASVSELHSLKMRSFRMLVPPTVPDLHLYKSVNKAKVVKGSNVIFTISIKNEGYAGATGVQVKDQIPVGATFVSATAASGTTYTSSTGIWSVPSIAVGDSISLSIEVTASSEGSVTNYAEVIAMAESDLDSTPNNGNFNEDDIASACYTVPVKVCQDEKATFTLSAPDSLSAVKWFKDGLELTAEAGKKSIIVSLPGSYTYSGAVGTLACPASSCCPIIIEYYQKAVAPKDTSFCTADGTYKLPNAPSGQVWSIITNAASAAVNPSTGALTGLLTAGLYELVLKGDTTCADTVKLTVINCAKGSLGDYVWKDANNNGIQDASEVGVSGVIIELYKGGVKVSADTTDASGKYLFTNLDAGNYNIKVVTSSLAAGCIISTNKDAGTDDAKDSDVDPTTGTSPVYVIDPTDVTKKDILTVDAGLYSPVGSIGDYVWKDTNNDGIQDASEVGVSGVIVELYKGGVKVSSDTTDTNGKYLFSNLVAGDYTVKLLTSSLPAGCVLSSKQNAGTDDTKDSDFDPTTGLSQVVTIDPLGTGISKDNPTVDGGLYSPKGSLGDYVWKDANNDGIQDATEVGVSGVIIELYKGGVKVSSDTTDASGKYLFSNLDAGSYNIKVVTSSLAAGCIISTNKDAGTDDAKDSDVDPATGESPVYVIDPTDVTKKDILTVDAGLYSPVGSIGDYVWKDTNNDGIQDASEVGVSGVIVELYKGGVKVSSDTTDTNGKYLFSNLVAGDYTVKLLTSSLPAGCILSSKQNAGTDDTKDSDFDPTTGLSQVVTIDPLGTGISKDNPTVDGGLYSPKGSLGDYVWKDANNNGIQDASEVGVSGVIIELYKGGVKVSADTTDGSGKYLFTNLDAGNYNIKVVTSSLAAGCIISTNKDAGVDDAKDSDVDPATGESPVYVIDPTDVTKKDILTVDAGLYSPVGSIGDYVWKDTNNDGIQDASEVGVSGVIVELYKGGVKVSSDTTDTNGKYLFSNLVAGDYTVKLLTSSLPAGCILSSKQDAGTDDTKDSDFDPTTGLSQVVTIDPLGTGISKDNPTVDGGLYSPKGSLGDYVWKDANNDGIQDATEVGVSGVIIELYKGGVKVSADTTDASGKYLFTNLDAGNYNIKVVTSSLAAGCIISTNKDAGADDAKDSDVDPTTGESPVYVIDPTDVTKKDILTVDAGLYSPVGSIGDYVWKDTNNDGIQDASEVGVSGVIIELYKGGVKVSSDTTDTNGMYLFSNLAAGDYTVKLITSSLPAGCVLSSKQNAGTDDTKDSDFDPTTGLSQVVTIDPLGTGISKDNPTVDGGLYSPKGSLGDYVWKDANNDGVQDATEVGVSGVIIELYKGGVKVSSDTTDASGKYLFSNLDGGSYNIKVVTSSLAAGCIISTNKDAGVDDAKDSDVDPVTGESPVYVIDPADVTKKDILTVDAGLYSPVGSIGDYVWKDTNNDGIQDASEVGVSGVIVELYKGGVKVSSDTTDTNGKYLFSNLVAGDYTVKLLTSSLPAGCVLSSKQNAGTDDTKDSDFDPTTGISQVVTINPLGTGISKDNPTVDGGLYSPKGSLGDYVWKDANNNGIQDASEVGVSGVIIELYKGGVKVSADTTDASGKYLFTNLDAGNYNIKVVTSSLAAGCIISTNKDAGTDDAKDSDVDPTTGTSPVYVIDPTDVTKKDILTVDAGLYSPVGSIGDYVWKDTNNDGIQDASEVGVSGVIVELYKGGVKVSSDTTDTNGKYLFSNLVAGDYTVKLLTSSLPAGCVLSSKQNAGTDDTKDSDFDPTTGISQVVTINPLGTGISKDNPTVDGGLYSPKGSLGDYVWKDANNNGIQDASEVGVSGVIIELYKGGVKVSADTTDASGKYLFTNLDAGNYNIKVVTSSLAAGCIISTNKDAGTDDAKDSDVDPTTGTSPVYVIDPTDVTKKDILTVDAGLYSPVGSIGDYVWKDTNNDGIQDASEVGVSGVIVELYKGGVKVSSDTTDTNGMYLFSNLAAGDYTVKLITSSLPAGCILSSKQDAGTDDTKDSDFDPTTGLSQVVTIDPLGTGISKDNPTVDGGLYSPKGSLGDYVWKDANNDGIQDATEVGVSGVIIELYKGGVKVSSDTTDASGKYLFSNLDAGSYNIKVVTSSLAAGCIISTNKDAGVDDAKDSDVDPATGESPVYVIDPTDVTKKDILTVDAGLYSPVGSIGDYVWKDTNNDGIQDASEVGVSGVIIELYKGGVKVSSDTTDTNGMYLFSNLAAGDYTVKLITSSLPAGCILSSKQDAGTDDTKDSDFDPTTGLSQVVTIDPLGTGISKDNPTVDGGLYSPKGSLGDYVWKDANNDGVQDVGETGVKGAVIELYKDGVKVSVDTTDINGKYLFTNLDAGNYSIKVVKSSLVNGCEISTNPNAGTDDAKDSDVDPTTGTSPVYVIDPTSPTKKDIYTVDIAVVGLGSIGDYVWFDMNKNGRQDSTDPAVADFRVVLYKELTPDNFVAFDTTYTNSTGYYLFDKLVSSNYKVSFLPGEFSDTTFTYKNPITWGVKLDSDADTLTGFSDVVYIDTTKPQGSPQRDNRWVDAGLVLDIDSLHTRLGSLEGYTFCDNNQNGIQDLGDAVLPNIQVILYQVGIDSTDNQTLVAVDTLFTGTDGRYKFDSLMLGSYQVLIVAPTNKTTTTPNVGTDDTKDSDVSTTTGKTGFYTVDPILPAGDPGRNVKYVDGGYYQQNCPPEICAPYTIKKVKKTP